jgi:hypothetical protein
VLAYTRRCGTSSKMIFSLRSKVDLLAVTDVAVLPPLCPRVIYVILSHCPLWGPRRWHRLISQIVLMAGVFPQGFSNSLASQSLLLACPDCHLLDDRTAGRNRVIVYSRSSRKGDAT